MAFIYKTIKYQLYLLQLENYELGRYFKLLLVKGFWPKKNQIQRKDLIWTKKALALMTMALGFHSIVFLLGVWQILLNNYLIGLAILGFGLLLSTFYFLLFTLALLLLWPFDFLAKQILINKAKLKILNLKSSIKIIGIAGSYGKTTMKEVLGSVLSSRFSVLSTPESVNTSVGIARWILNKVDQTAEILIVEMGEHYKGDVKEICEIAKPDIAVVTGINEAHLERMRTLENVVATVFEIVSSAKAGSTIMLNADDENVMKNYKEFISPDHKLLFFGKKNKSNFEFRISNFEFDADKLGWNIKIEGLGTDFINLLGEYSIADIDATVQIAKQLGMGTEEIKKGLGKIKPVQHRLQPIKSSGDVLIIDDAYNGNSAGVAEAIKVLGRFPNRRKVFITPGLVESGKATAAVHREIGKQLAGIADVVILIKNSVTPYIEEGILSVPSRVHPRDPLKNEGQGIPPLHSVQGRNGGPPEVIWFDSAQKAHTALGKILKPGDVVLFQNDWGDQYV